MGTAVVAPLAEVLSTEQDARSRRRLREVLLGFGASGREAVQQLMNATNWEVRRTAAYLLREFGGTEGLKELVPLLSDGEPLVRREAVQGLALNGSDEASALLLTALTTSTGKAKQTLASDVMGLRDRRAVPFFAFVLRRMDPAALPHVYASRDRVDCRDRAGRGHRSRCRSRVRLQARPVVGAVRTRRRRTTIAAALRKIGTPEAIEALRTAASSGPRGVRVAARSQLSGLI